MANDGWQMAFDQLELTDDEEVSTAADNNRALTPSDEEESTDAAFDWKTSKKTSANEICLTTDDDDETTEEKTDELEQEEDDVRPANYRVPITFDIGGVYYETTLATLLRQPNTRLGRLALSHSPEHTEPYLYD